MANEQRRAAAFARPPVKTSVRLDVRTHAKLCACAALRSVDRSTLAAEFIRAGLRDVVVMDSRRKSSRANDERRSEEEDETIDDEEKAS
jgi:hypothetical protein